MAVVDAYLANYEPVDYYDYDTCTLIDTQTMILEMNTMCNFDENMLCDYIASKGFRAYYAADDALSGWMMKEID